MELEPDGKVKIYTCDCGAKPHRPLSPAHTEYKGHYPKPCDNCGQSLDDAPFEIRKGIDVAREMLARPHRVPPDLTGAVSLTELIPKDMQGAWAERVSELNRKEQAALKEHENRKP